MGKLYIRGLVKTADRVRRDLAQPLSAERRQELRRFVAESLQQVDGILASHGAKSECLPAPTRRAYEFLANLDLDAATLVTAATATDAQAAPGGSVRLAGVKSYWDNVLLRLARVSSLSEREDLHGSIRSATAEDAVYELAKAAFADAERVLGKKVEKVVATCPADFDDAQKQALRDAIERTGVEVLLLFHEPTAAGLVYADDLQGGQFLVGVSDFGAGTYDFSVLAVNGDVAEVRATEGVRKLGGNDVNAGLLGLVLDHIEEECGIRPAPEEQPLLFHELRIRIEQAKVSLNTQDKVPVVTSFEGNQVITEITRQQLHQVLDPLVDQLLSCMDRGVKAAGATYQDLHRLVLVGGASHNAYVQEKIADHTGLAPRCDVDPDRAVAYGAALRCVIALHEQGVEPQHNNIVIPAPAVITKDVTGHGVGCCVIETSTPTHRLINSVIIKKNTPIPCRRVDSFYLQHNDQREASVEILQGDRDANRDDCLLIGELVLDNLPPETTRTKRIQVEFSIDASGMVTATVTDRVSGRQATVSVDYKKGIKPKPKLKPFAA